MRSLLIALLLACTAPPALAVVIHSPSGNVRCRSVGLRAVICTSRVPSRSVELIAGRRAFRIPLHPIATAGLLVVYGDAWGGDLGQPEYAVQCAPEWSAVICSDAAAHGFAISRARVETW